MTDKDAAAARARGQALRDARVARARTIRRRVISAGIALFVAAWLMITIVLVSGHDPALASKTSAGSSATVASTPSTTTATTTTPTTSSSGSTGSSSNSASNSSSSSSSGSSSSGSGVSSVTTSQS